MHVFLIAAITADGQIARSKEQVSTAWTSKEDSQFFRQKTKEARIMVMGRSTFETIGRGLPGRVTIVLTRSAATDLPSELEDGAVIETSLKLPELVNRLAAAGHEQLAICGGSSVYTQALQDQIVETVFLTIEPTFFGAGVPLFNTAFSHDVELQLRHLHQLSSQTIVLEYSVKKETG